MEQLITQAKSGDLIYWPLLVPHASKTKKQEICKEHEDLLKTKVPEGVNIVVVPYYNEMQFYYPEIIHFS